MGKTTQKNAAKPAVNKKRTSTSKKTVRKKQSDLSKKSVTPTPKPGVPLAFAVGKSSDSTLTVTVKGGLSVRRRSGVAVVLTNADNFKTDILFTDKSGSCTFANLEEGRYSVAAVDTRLDESMNSALDYLMILAPNKNYTKELELGEIGGIGSITVVVTQGTTPCQGAFVQVEFLSTQVEFSDPLPPPPPPPYNETGMTSLPGGEAQFDPPNGWCRATVINQGQMIVQVFDTRAQSKLEVGF